VLVENYLISPEDGRALIAIHEASSLREAARSLGCDPAGLHRRARRLSAQSLLRKVSGQWVLTERGRILMAWTRASILSQRRLLMSDETVRICSTTWLAERALIPRLPELTKLIDPRCGRFEFSVPVRTFEKTLLEGNADFVLACHPPEDPAIAHRMICPEVWVAVVRRRSLKSRARMTIEDLGKLPYIQHRKMNPGVFTFREDERAPELEGRSSFSTDNLIGVRAAVVAGLGWSFVPQALVADEIRSGRLEALEVELEAGRKMDRKICLWWLRESEAARALAPALTQWTKTCF
jgi:DNA-binding transcriptional LysR family regulator